MFGFKLVKKDEWKQEQQLLQTFKETILNLDKECGEFVDFILNKIHLDNYEFTSSQLNRHMSLMDSFLSIYVKNPLSSPLYDINLMEKNEEARQLVVKLKYMVKTINNTIITTECAKQKIHENERNLDEEELDEMEEKLDSSFHDFLNYSKKDLDKIANTLIKTIYDIHCALIHDILRVLMGVDILMEYHNKKNIKVKNNILQSFRIDVLQINSNNIQKKGEGDSNESIIK